MLIVRKDHEINDLLEACMEAEHAGITRVPTMTYEQGVAAAIDWLIRREATNPLTN